MKNLKHFATDDSGQVVAGFTDETKCRNWIASERGSGQTLSYAPIGQVQDQLATA